MEHLDAATLEEFQAFNHKFYIPNNAVLVVAGDFETAEAKEWIHDYFGDIPAGDPIQRTVAKEEPITSVVKATWEDPNIQIPMYVIAYRTPGMATKDAYTLDMISTLLSGGKSSRLYKKMVDDDKVALQVGAFNYAQEDYGSYIIYGMPMGNTSRDEIIKGYDSEIKKLQNELISEREYQKLLNVVENRFVSSNSNIEGIAHTLATDYLLYGDTSLVNNEINIYRSITREDIQAAAKKYLNPNQRVELDYIPAKENSKQ